VYARVIVGTDGSDRARQVQPIGAYAASAFGCPLELVHVPAADDPAELRTTRVRVLPRSDPADGLVAYATATEPPGLLCLSSRGRSTVGEVVLGSVTSQVIRILHAPMLTTGPAVSEPTRPWQRLLVCLDGSANAASILPVATAWANHLDLEVQLLYVAYPLGDPRTGDFAVPDEDLAAAQQLTSAAEGLEAAGIAVRWSVREHTQVAAGIAEQAAHGLADLIALATHGRTGLARLVAGSVALDVIRHATVPVLTVRPEQLT
jgi:nucleotide-binding universal stress UspA family protein